MQHVYNHEQVANLSLSLKSVLTDLCSLHCFLKSWQARDAGRGAQVVLVGKPDIWYVSFGLPLTLQLQRSLSSDFEGDTYQYPGSRSTQSLEGEPGLHLIKLITKTAGNVGTVKTRRRPKYPLMKRAADYCGAKTFVACSELSHKRNFTLPHSNRNFCYTIILARPSNVTLA